MTLWIISHLITCCQQCFARTVFRGMAKAPTLTQLSQRRSRPVKGPGQGRKSFDCQLKRAICTQEEKGQPIPAPMNATGCQCQSWLVWASITTEGVKQRLRLLWLGGSTASQDHEDWAVGYQLWLTVFLLHMPGQRQQKITHYDAESLTIGWFYLWIVSPIPVHGESVFVFYWAT